MLFGVSGLLLLLLLLILRRACLYYGVASCLLLSALAHLHVTYRAGLADTQPLAYALGVVVVRAGKQLERLILLKLQLADAAPIEMSEPCLG